MVILASTPIAIAWRHSYLLPFKRMAATVGVCLALWSAVNALSVSGPNKLLSAAELIRKKSVLDQMTRSVFVWKPTGIDPALPVCEVKVHPGIEPFLLLEFQYRIQTTRIGDWERTGQSPNLKLTYLTLDGKEVKRPNSPPTMLPANVELATRQETWGNAWRIVRIPAAARVLRIDLISDLPGTVSIRNFAARGAVWYDGPS